MCSGYSKTDAVRVWSGYGSQFVPASLRETTGARPVTFDRSPPDAGIYWDTNVQARDIMGGSISPDELFHRVNARRRWLENIPDGAGGEENRNGIHVPREAVCIADLESIERFAVNVSVIPGGISNIEVEALHDMADILSMWLS